MDHRCVSHAWTRIAPRRAFTLDRSHSTLKWRGPGESPHVRGRKFLKRFDRNEFLMACSTGERLAAPLLYKRIDATTALSDLPRHLPRRARRRRGLRSSRHHHRNRSPAAGGFLTRRVGPARASRGATIVPTQSRGPAVAVLDST